MTRVLIALAVALTACRQESGPPSPPPATLGEAPAPRPFARARLGDRVFVQAVLSDVFGPSIAPDLAELVHANPAAFGGSCSLYEQVYVDQGQPEAALVDEATLCVGGMPALNHPLVGNSSTLRAGWLAKACMRITTQPAAMQYAVAQLFSARPAAAPDATSAAAAWRRFYPGRTAPADVVEALVGITPEASVADRWRRIHLVLCLTPDWQIP